jgi:hypothetical protein
MADKHVILRVKQRDGTHRYELYREPSPRATGERLVVYVDSGDLEWALRTAERLDIPDEDVRIGFDSSSDQT